MSTQSLLFGVGVDKGATFSPARKYRYTLHRIWDVDKPTMAVIGLNPSTADETKDDPTIRRCIGFAKLWGYGGLYMLNLFAYRSTDPAALKIVKNPIGPDNDKAILEVASKCKLVIAAWGNDGAIDGRGHAVRNLLTGFGLDVHCLKKNMNGTPAHPLYLPGDLQPTILWPKS